MTEKEILAQLSRQANAKAEEKKDTKSSTKAKSTTAKPKTAKTTNSKSTTSKPASTKTTTAKSTSVKNQEKTTKTSSKTSTAKASTPSTKTKKETATKKIKADKVSIAEENISTQSQEVIENTANLEDNKEVLAPTDVKTNTEVEVNTNENISASSGDNNNNIVPPISSTSDETPKLPEENHSALSEISKEPEEQEEEVEPMTLLDHLKELRIRLTRILIMLIIGFFASYSFAEFSYNYLTEPLTAHMPANASLIYTSPPGLFFVYLKVAFVMSFFVSSPYTFYQLWAFVAPGLYSEEKKVLIPLSLVSAFFFLSGAAFCYYMVLPIAFKFFMGFATVTITPMISVEEYLTFVLKLLIAFGLVFEMPLFSFFLSRMGIITAKMMRKWRKYSILMMFICAALLTPPDVFSQTLMAMPMILLYEISILIAQMVEKEKKEAKDSSEAKIQTK